MIKQLTSLTDLEEILGCWVRDQSGLNNVYLAGYDIKKKHPYAMVIIRNVPTFGRTMKSQETTYESGVPVKKNLKFEQYSTLKLDVNFFEEARTKKSGEDIANTETGLKHAKHMQAWVWGTQSDLLLNPLAFASISEPSANSIVEGKKMITTGSVSVELNFLNTFVEENAGFFTTVEEPTYNLEGA